MPMHKAVLSIAAFLIVAWAPAGMARERGDQSIGAEMSRERAESRIDRIKTERSGKESRTNGEKARAQGKTPAKKPAADPMKP